jgi:hypothetical protein
MAAADRTMFEIYREAGYARQYRVVYFTELDEHNKEAEINRAMAGEHFYDGFLTDAHKEKGKHLVEQILARLNQGEAVSPSDVDQALSNAGIA